MTQREASRGYLICSSPRSGSTLLCDLLSQTQVAGKPESFFQPASIRTYADAWDLELDSDGWGRTYVDSVRQHGEAGTGCFGMRIMWSDMPRFLERLRSMYPESNSDRERLRLAFGVEDFIHLSRHDKVSQAVSLVVAAQTGLWHRNADGSVREGVEPTELPHYDRPQIADELRMLEAEEHGWETWLQQHSIVPLVLTYETLSLDPVARTQDALNHIGRSCDEVPSVGTTRLATSLNQEWAARFRSDPKHRKDDVSPRP